MCRAGGRRCTGSTTGSRATQNTRQQRSRARRALRAAKASGDTEAIAAAQRRLDAANAAHQTAKENAMTHNNDPGQPGDVTATRRAFADAMARGDRAAMKAARDRLAEIDDEAPERAAPTSDDTANRRHTGRTSTRTSRSGDEHVTNIVSGDVIGGLQAGDINGHVSFGPGGVTIDGVPAAQYRDVTPATQDTSRPRGRVTNIVSGNLVGGVQAGHISGGVSFGPKGMRIGGNPAGPRTATTADNDTSPAHRHHDEPTFSVQGNGHTISTGDLVVTGPVGARKHGDVTPNRSQRDRDAGTSDGTVTVSITGSGGRQINVTGSGQVIAGGRIPRDDGPGTVNIADDETPSIIQAGRINDGVWVNGKRVQ